ncbi:MAG: YqiJ family protein [Bacteroides sp.]|nr:YqiJ family protein [Bacteroides sp.]
MQEFFSNLMHPLPNAVMTVIMGILALYWLVVFFFGAGFEDLDLGFDFDVDVPEPDVDVADNLDTSGPGEEGIEKQEPGFFTKSLTYLNVGRVPFMLVLSTFKFLLWVCTLIATQFIQVTSWGLASLLILIPLAFVAIFFTHYATNPLVRFFHHIGYKGEEEIDFLGRIGKMVSNIHDTKTGTAEFVVDKNPIRLHVRSMDGKPLKYGEKVIVVDETDKGNVYLVSRELTIDDI